MHLLSITLKTLSALAPIYLSQRLLLSFLLCALTLLPPSYKDPCDQSGPPPQLKIRNLKFSGGEGGRGGIQEEGIYVYLRLIHVVVRQKLNIDVVKTIYPPTKN